MPTAIEVEVGALYRHRKGNVYRVVRVAMHSETHEWMVVYEAALPDPSSPSQVWVRPLEMFADGRFTLVI